MCDHGLHGPRIGKMLTTGTLPKDRNLDVPNWLVVSSRGTANNDRGITNKNRGITNNNRGITNNNKGITSKNRSITNNDNGIANMISWLVSSNFCYYQSHTRVMIHLTNIFWAGLFLISNKQRIWSTMTIQGLCT